MRLLHDLYSDVRTLKGDINTTLDMSCSERQKMYDFIKTSKVLREKNTTDIGKIRELFQKYGYRPPDRDNSVEKDEANSKSVSDNNSDREKMENMTNLPACVEKLALSDPLRMPQLSDFGLSQYAFSRTWNMMHVQPQPDIHKEEPRNSIPVIKEALHVIPKTPKCTLRMDDYVCLTTKLEHFGISEHTMCLNEDYTLALINKTKNKM
uniref:Spindle and kinetochore-associated protein 3 n=1 Tax=Sphenodon punctatus TaxID=8508 RepID=A0A8D0LA52_SPHPU